MNQLRALRNRYFLMRHGQSKANAAKVIVGSVARDASGEYGLTSLGREQALAAAVKSGLPEGTVICSSPLSRARETAEIVRGHLGASGVAIADSLCERDFGDWEGTSTANYEKVWADDLAGRVEHGVEPVAAVLDRTAALVAELERQHEDRTVLLVAHGDILQILQAGLQGLDPKDHRSVEHLKTAEIRQVPGRRSALPEFPSDQEMPSPANATIPPDSHGFTRVSVAPGPLTTMSTDGFPGKDKNSGKGAGLADGFGGAGADFGGQAV